MSIVNNYTISILVYNKPGVLVRLSQLFSRRGYNLSSVVVSPSTKPEFSHMTVVVEGDPEVFDQIIRQLNKLVDVVHAAHYLPENAVERELALFKISVTAERRTEVFQIADVFRSKTIDITEDSVIMEATGDSGKLDALEKVLAPIGIVEMVRSGKLVMVRGPEPTTKMSV